MNRRILFPALLAITALVVTSCASASAPASTSDGDDHGVTFAHPTEDLEVSLEAQPETIVMDCYAYSSMHEYGIEPDALFGYDCENSFVMGDIDTSGIERVGQDGEIDIEKVAALRPDVVVGHGSAEGFTWFDEEVNAQLTRVAPFIPLPVTETIDEGIAATRDIAEFLGADVGSDAVAASDDGLSAAKDAFRDVVDGTDLRIMLASPTKEMLYTAVGSPQADLLEDLGATIIGVPEPESGNPWGQAAWEEASSYDADIILVEGYSDDYWFTSELWEALPAVEAGQLGNWGSKGAATSSAYAAWLTELTELVESSENVA